MGLHKGQDGAAWSQLTDSNSHKVLLHLRLPEHLTELWSRKRRIAKKQRGTTDDKWGQWWASHFNSTKLYTITKGRRTASQIGLQGKKAIGCGSTNWHLASWGDINFRSRFPGAAKINANLHWHSDWFCLQWLGVYHVTNRKTGYFL